MVANLPRECRLKHPDQFQHFLEAGGIVVHGRLIFVPPCRREVSEALMKMLGQLRLPNRFGMNRGRKSRFKSRQLPEMFGTAVILSRAAVKEVEQNPEMQQQ